jgi:hypothetical protein
MLPDSFSADEITQMYEELETDVALLKQAGIPQKTAEARLHQKHKTLAYSYPTIFFKAVRGEMDRHIFDTLLKIKRQVEDGEVSNERAKELVIDGAKSHVEGDAPRLPISNPKHSTSSSVHEINIRCRVEDDQEDAA